MKILKFEGATMRDAIAKVKAELGDQAVIIATRQIRKGLIGTATEISAAIDDDDRAPAGAYGMAGPTTGGPSNRQHEPDLEKLIGPLRSELRSLRALVRTSGEPRGNPRLEGEIAELRKLVEDMRPLPEPPPRRSTRAIEDDYADLEIEHAPRQAELERARSPRSDQSERNDRNPNLTLASHARNVMLVGPTGAGKTTTIAKLAARAALIEGKRVKLVTLDNFRVGGVDQIRTFADLIGLPLEVIENPADLADILDDSYDLVLIDTAGRSPRETGPVADLAEVLADLPPVEVHVVIPASTSASAIDQLVARYQALQPARLLFTKLDEVEHAAELTRAPTRTRLPITWVTTGQAVPEDLEEPTRARLIELAGDSNSTTKTKAA